MEFNDIKKTDNQYLFQNYGRLDVAFDHGEGMYLYDCEGVRYLDLVAGIAVNSLGYSHPKWTSIIRDQVSKLCHVSNLYYIKEQAIAAEKIASVTPKGLDRVLFVNSGAEANEAALKLAVRSTGRKKVLSAFNSFHGRTAGALGATGQPKYQETFEPLISDSYHYFDYNDIEGLKRLIDKDVAAVLIEPIQGEGGVNVGDPDFIRAIRDLCTDNGSMMIVDEVQTGMGRTGKWFGIDHYGVVPDIMSMAKALGSGMPVGAVATTEEFFGALSPGTHGTTFGGGPLVTASVSATIDIMKEERLVENSFEMGRYWRDSISSIGSDEIVDIRGNGLMIGVEMRSKANDFRKYCLENAVLVNVCHGNTVRMIPPLIIGKVHCDVLTGLMRDFLE